MNVNSGIRIEKKNKNRTYLNRKDLQISFLTRGVAVAVRAKTGTSGRSSFTSDNLLEHGSDIITRIRKSRNV